MLDEERASVHALSDEELRYDAKWREERRPDFRARYMITHKLICNTGTRRSELRKHLHPSVLPRRIVIGQDGR